MKKNIILLFFISAQSLCFAAPAPFKLLHNSQQLIVVSTVDWNSTKGQLRRFSREAVNQPWKIMGKSIPVVIGKYGLGWDLHFNQNRNVSSIKKEGDGLTPVGIYAIGPTFGFDKKNNKNYFPIDQTSVCVDDTKSIYYNQLIDSSKISQKDWQSGEQMREIPQYKYGAVIQYNNSPIKPNAGSCIFMHIWKSPTAGTAGCVAMAEPHLQETLNWLNIRKNPIIAIFPMVIYKKIKTKWQLPTLESSS